MKKSAKIQTKIQTKKMVFAAMLIALSVVIGWVCKSYLTFGDGSVRVTFENLPVILAGLWLGPVYGALVGAASDIVSALLSGYDINPIITVGAASVGLVSGLMTYALKNKRYLSVMAITFSAHAVGSVLIKSLGLSLWGYAVVFPVRVLLYIGIALAESYIIYILYNNKGISSGIERMFKK